MLAHTIFSFADTSPEQALAFIGIAISQIAFLVWVLYLVRA
jgi:hypothetical protein